MTGRKAYEMFTGAFGSLSNYQRKQTQFGDDALIAWDDLGWAEQGAWRLIASRIDKHAKRSSSARAARS